MHLPNVPLWDRVKVQSEIMARAWVKVNKEEMKNAGTKNKKRKENLDDFFEEDNSEPAEDTNNIVLEY
jgi:hypothetical protein